MHDRTLLGPADVTDDELTRMVADAARRGARLRRAARLPGRGGRLRPPGDHHRGPLLGLRYGAHAGGRASRSGCSSSTCSRGAGRRSSPRSRRSSTRWRRRRCPGAPRPLAYASDLGDRLPDGLSMPRALGVYDLDELSAAIWLEEVDRPSVDVGPRALPAGGVPPRPDGRQPPGRAAGQRRRLRVVGARSYAFGRLGMQVLPSCASDGDLAAPGDRGRVRRRAP